LDNRKLYICIHDVIVWIRFTPVTVTFPHYIHHHVKLLKVVQPKMNLLTLKLFQTRVSFFLLLKTKEDILMNVGNQTVDRPHWLPW